MSATALYKALIEAKVPEGVAEKAVDELDSAIETAAKAEFAKLQAAAEKAAAEKPVEGSASTREVATKEDIREVKEDVRKVAKKVGEVEKEVAKLRTEIVQSEVRSLRWQLAIAGVIIAAIGLFDKLP